jgi:RecJ-like exonuclease
LCERQYKDTLKWLATSKVAAGDPIAGRAALPPSFWRAFDGGQKKVAAVRPGVSNGAVGSDSAKGENAGEFVVCEDCKGRKTVPEEIVCSRCNGAGSVVRQTRIKDLSGNALPAKEAKCTKCNGKGVIVVGRKSCETCGGKGRLPI